MSNNYINKEEQLTNTWVSSNNTSKTFLESTDDPFQYNTNMSGNELDVNNKYIEKKSHEWYINHRNDLIRNKGFEYRGNILKRSLSGAMFIETKRKGLLEQLEKVLVYLVDSIKHIKKSYNYTLEKDYVDFN